MAQTRWESVVDGVVQKASEDEDDEDDDDASSPAKRRLKEAAKTVIHNKREEKIERHSKFVNARWRFEHGKAPKEFVPSDDEGDDGSSKKRGKVADRWNPSSSSSSSSPSKPAAAAVAATSTASRSTPQKGATTATTTRELDFSGGDSAKTVAKKKVAPAPVKAATRDMDFSSEGGTTTADEPSKKEGASPRKNSKPRYYPAEDKPKTKACVLVKQNPAKIRSSISPGTILILLAGRFRAKRVVCLKVLKKSGLLLVSGPYKINGVPLRRVNPAYVIATSTKLDVSSIDVSFVTDEYFSRAKDDLKPEGEEEFFLGDAPKPAVVSKQRKQDQKRVDDELIKIVQNTDPMLESYLAALFTLTKSDKPHRMKF